MPGLEMVVAEAARVIAGRGAEALVKLLRDRLTKDSSALELCRRSSRSRMTLRVSSVFSRSYSMWSSQTASSRSNSLALLVTPCRTGTHVNRLRLMVR